MKVGSLFSGIGGIDLGLQWAGMTTIWFVENDKYCQKVLAKHWPEVPCYGDIKAVDFRTLPRPDLLCGGFPCQPFSVAGKRQGTADDRWLWPEFYRAICEIKPRWVLVENVPGLLSIDSGRVFGGILRDLAQVGYDAEWDVLSAAQFGAPHLRFRVFLVANSISGRCFKDRKYRCIDGISREWTDDTMSTEKSSEDVAYAKHSLRWPVLQGRDGFADWHERKWPETADRFKLCGEDVVDASEPGLPESKPKWKYGKSVTECNWWSTEPDVGRVAHGIPSRVDRLKCLGNAVVPQVAQWIGERIMEVELFND